METLNNKIEEIKKDLTEKEGINSPMFSKSSLAFTTILKQHEIESILDTSSAENENNIYAKLIMTPEQYESMGNSLITHEDMSLKRLHSIQNNLETEQIEIIPGHILLNEKVTLDEIDYFLEIRTTVLNNIVLTSILEQTTGTQIKYPEYNILFAEKLISSEKYKIIGEEFLRDENMSPQKMFIIERELPIDFIKAIGGEFLAHKNMTVDKILLIGQMLTVEQILDIGAEKLALMSEDELQEILYN